MLRIWINEQERDGIDEAARSAFYVARGLKARQRNRQRRAALSGNAEELPVTAEERRLRGRLGGLVARSRHDPRETTAAGRAALAVRFESHVDPEGVLPEHERARRAGAARRAFFATLCLRSLQARDRRKRQGRAGGDPNSGTSVATRRTLAGRIGVYTRLATHDAHDLTLVILAAREGSERRLRRLLEPGDGGSPEERRQAFESAKSEHFRALARLRMRK